MPICTFCSSLGGGDSGNECTLADMRLIDPIQVKLRTRSMLGFRCLETRKLLRRRYSLQYSRAQPVARHVLYTMSRNDERNKAESWVVYKCETWETEKGRFNPVSGSTLIDVQPYGRDKPRSLQSPDVAST